MTELSRDESLSVLRWLVDAGADEAVNEDTVDRFALPPPRAAVAPQPTPAAYPSAHDRADEPARMAPRAVIAPGPESTTAAPSAARALAASCTTLAELKAALEGFEGSELKRRATKTVFADGSPQARIMLIGEAPGREEDLRGLPFVGRAGQLLDRMLAAIGLDRTKVYITNVLPWRPPANRDPSSDEAALCLPFLHRHIELMRPEILVLLGAVSARHVLGSNEGIMRLRGKWENYQITAANAQRTVPVMPTLHPAFLLRQPVAKRLAWRDLLAIAEKAEQLGLA